MAPPISRRSKQNSPNSPPPPIPLPGIALGLFAAIAAAFAASRALRRKKPAQSLQSEQPIAFLVQEREIEIKEKDDSFNGSAILVNANGTITIAHEPSKLAAGLNPAVFDAFEELSFAQKRDAKSIWEGRREDEEEKGGEEECRNGEREEAEKEGEFAENKKKKGENMENGETASVGEESEVADITVKMEASLVVDEASVQGLKSAILEEKEEEEQEATTEAEGEGEDDGVIDDDDPGHDGDDDRSSADQQPSPVLINGRILDFFQEMPDFKDDPDLLSSGSNSLSDAVSDSSMQEVSSAPVKPFVPTDETLEALWPRAKPDYFVALNQSGQENAFPEDKNWYDNEKNLFPLEDGLSEMKKGAPEFVENLSQTGQNFIELKHDWLISNDDTLHLKLSEHDVDVGILNLKPVLVDIEERESSDDKINQIKFEILSDVTDAEGNSLALEGEVSIKVNGLDEGIAESTTINDKVLSNGSPLPLPEELDDLESIGEDETSLQTGQAGTDGAISDALGDPDSVAAVELSDDMTCESSKGELYDDESTQAVACLGIDASEKLGVVMGFLEEPVPQPAALKFDTVDSASAENNVNLEQEKSSFFIASRGITEGNELSCEGSTDNVELSSGREDINDGLSEQIVVEGRNFVKEQEIEEITRSCDLNDLIFETKKLASLAESAYVSDDDTREVDYLVSKGAAHHHGLQSKGGFSSKVLQYLPLEIGFICLLIALVSFALWYLEVSPLMRS